MMPATPAAIGGAERDELDPLDPVRRVLDERQLVMRVDRGVAVPGKMLAAGGDALGLQRLDDNRTDPRHILRPLGQRAVANRRVVAVGEDVEHRGEVERDADRPQFRGQRPGEPLRQTVVAAPAERPHRRPDGERALEPRDAAPFLIDAHPQRQLAGQPPGVARDLRNLLGLGDVARKEDHAAEVEFRRQPPQFIRNRMPREAGNHQLANLATNPLRRHCCRL